MKRAYALLATLSVIIMQNGYSQKMPTDYFTEAAVFVKNKDYPKAIAAYQYIITHHKKNDLYHESFFNLAYTFLLLKNYDSATCLFKAIISGEFDDGEIVGGNTMASPYANYKNQASEILSNIYYRQQKYDSSLHYLALSDTVYNYRHFCGNEIEENEINTALQYADLYQKLNAPQKAISSLLIMVFEDLVSDNSEVLKQLQILLKKSNKKNLIDELDKSILNIYSKVKGSGKRYFFNFLDTEIEVFEDYNEKESSKEKAIKKIKQSDFYKLISAIH